MHTSWLVFLALFGCAHNALYSMNTEQNKHQPLSSEDIQNILTNQNNLPNITFLQIPTKKTPESLSKIKKPRKCGDCKHYRNFVQELKVLIEPENRALRCKKMGMIQALLKEYGLTSDSESEDDKE